MHSQYQFPVSHEDVVSVVKFFLQDKILIKYGVDPARIYISGDSSRNALTATVTQQMCIMCYIYLYHTHYNSNTE